MKKFLFMTSLFFAVIAGYCFYQWQLNYTGSISVTVPKGTDVIIEGDFLYVKTIDSCCVPLDYGRYVIRVPEYNIECMIHKNNRGNALIDVVDVNEFNVKCDSNAWLVRGAD